MCSAPVLAAADFPGPLWRARRFPRASPRTDLGRFYRGDEAYFRSLVDGLSPGLRRYVRGYVRDPDIAEDVLQDVWTTVFLKRRQYRSAGSLQGWIRGITRNACLMTLRSRRVERRCTSSLDQWAAPECPYRACERADVRELLGVALAALSARERTIVRGRILDGRTAVDLARELDCPVGTVRSTLHRASRKLRAALATPIPPPGR